MPATDVAGLAAPQVVPAAAALAPAAALPASAHSGAAPLVGLAAATAGAAVAPAMSAAPARSVGIRSVFAPLFGQWGSRGPVDSPLSWVVAAAALGQIGQTRRGAWAGSRLPSPASASQLVADTPTVRAPLASTGVVTGSAVFVNTAGGTLTYTTPATSTGGGAVSINAGTGAFTYTPTQGQRQNAGVSTTDTFTVTATNGNLSAVQTITVAVDPGTPVAGSSPVVRTPGVVNGALSGYVSARDSVGGPLTFTAPGTSAGGGAVTILDAATGTFSYTPTPAQRQSAGLSTTDTFTVTISNGARSITQVVTVPVDPGTPVAATPIVKTALAADGKVTGTARFSEPVGRTLTYTVASTSAGGGSVSYNSGTGAFSYIPTQSQRQSAGANTTDTFTVIASNGLRSTTQTVTVPVDPGTPIGGSPWVRPVTPSTGVVTGLATARDSVGGALSYTAPATSTGGGGVSVNAGTGAFTYTPTQAQRQNAGASTTDTFTVTISNGGRSITQVVTVPVDPGTPVVGGSPVVRTPGIANGALSGYVSATDSVGGALTFTAPGTSTGGGSVTINNPTTGTFTYTPTQAQRQNAGLSTTDTFTVTISNGARTTTQVVTVPVDPGTPVAGSLSVKSALAADGKVTGTALFSEPVGRTLTYTVASTSAGGGSVSYNSGTGAFTYIPTQAQRQSAGVNTTDTFTVIASNGLRSTTRTVTVPVDPGTPISGGSPWVRPVDTRNGVVTGFATARDSVGGALTYTAPATSTGGGSVTLSGGNFTYTPTQAQRQNAGANTTDTFTVTISNGARTITQLVTVPVDPGTPVPGANGAWVRTPGVVNGAVTGFATATDSVGGPLTYTAPGTSAGGGTVTINNPTTGTFTYTPTQAQRQSAGLSTTDTFTVTISNGGRTATQVVTVPVDPGTPVAATPTLRSPNSAGDGAVSGFAQVTDGSGRVLTFTAPTTSAGGGTVSYNSVTGFFTYTPTLAQRQNAGLSTTDTFTISATNGLRSTSRTVTVPVDPGTPVSRTPTVRTPNTITGVVTGNARFIEPVGRTLTYSAPSTSNGGGSVSVNASTGEFIYTPTVDQRQNAFQGTTDTFTVTASNGLRSTTQTVQVLVNPNARPVVSNLSLTPQSGGVIAGTLSMTDADSDTVTYTVTGGPANGNTVVMNASTGAFTYTPSSSARQDAANAPTAAGLSSGKWGQDQLASVQRNGCTQSGGVCQVSGFGQARNDIYNNWWTYPSWSSGDYVQLVDSGQNYGNLPDLALIQYSSNGTQKQVIAANGYVEALGEGGILYAGVANGTRYYISNAVGLTGYSDNYTYVVTDASPNRSQLASYVATTTPLAAGQVRASNDTFTVQVTDGRGGSTVTTIIVPIVP